MDAPRLRVLQCATSLTSLLSLSVFVCPPQCLFVHFDDTPRGHDDPALSSETAVLLRRPRSAAKGAASGRCMSSFPTDYAAPAARVVDVA